MNGIIKFLLNRVFKRLVPMVSEQNKTSVDPKNVDPSGATKSIFSFARFFLTPFFLIKTCLNRSRLFHRSPEAHASIPTEIRNQILSTIEMLQNTNPEKYRLYIFREAPGRISNRWTGLKIKYARFFSRWSDKLLLNHFIDRNSQWNLLSSYGDQPFIDLYEFGKHIQGFPAPLQEKLSNGVIDKANCKFAGKSSTAFWDMMRLLFGFQCRWVNELFVITPPSSDIENGLENQASNSVYHYQAKALFSLTGQTLNALMIISAFLQSAGSGLLNYRSVREKIIAYMRIAFTQMQSKARFADWLFYHGATWNCWFQLIGWHDFEKNISPLSISNSVQFIKKVEDSALKETADVFKIMIVSNPLSVFLMPHVMCDYSLISAESIYVELEGDETLSITIIADTDTDIPAANISRIFEMEKCSADLFWLANYAYSGLISSCQSPESFRFNFAATADGQSFFDNRFKFIGKLMYSLSKLYHKEGAPPEAGLHFDLFGIFFYKFLLTDWLKKNTRHLFFPAAQKGRPSEQVAESIDLCHFTLKKSNPDTLSKIKKDISAGIAFENIAREYADDYRMRLTSGRRGWINRGDLPPYLEAVIFLPSSLNQIFITDIDEYHHIYKINKIKEIQELCFFEQLIELQCAGELGLTAYDYTQLFDPLKQILSLNIILTGDDEKERRKLENLYERAAFYMRMLAFSASNRRLIDASDD
jgi:hypothetical protein